MIAQTFYPVNWPVRAAFVMIAAYHSQLKGTFMNTRPAWGMLTFGAVIVIALLLSPIWLKQFSGYIEEEAEQAIFPDAFYLLPNEEQDLYNELLDTSTQMAVDFVGARLAEPVDIEEPNLPAIDPNPAEVDLLLTGNFVPITAIRRAAGTASIYRLSDGRRVLRLENLDALNGPDLHVLLSAYPNPTTQEDLDQVPQFQIDVGPLKGNQGNQNYIIEDPAFNFENYVDGSVVLYSTRYEIVFSFAALTAPSDTP
jgi:hypothetical protein